MPLSYKNSQGVGQVSCGGEEDGEKKERTPALKSSWNVYYNKARVLALYKSYSAAMNKIFVYAHLCVNKDFVHDDVFSCVLSLFLSTPKSTAMIKNFLGFFLESSFVLATRTKSKSRDDVSQIREPEWFVEKSAVKTDI